MPKQAKGPSLPYPTDTMSADDLAAWIEHMGYNKKVAAQMLDISRSTLDRYLETGPSVTVALACAALAFGLPPWTRTFNR